MLSYLTFQFASFLSLFVFLVDCRMYTYDALSLVEQNKKKKRECEGENNQQLTIHLSPKDGDDDDHERLLQISSYKRRRFDITYNT